MEIPTESESSSDSIAEETQQALDALSGPDVEITFLTHAACEHFAGVMEGLGWRRVEALDNTLQCWGNPRRACGNPE